MKKIWGFIILAGLIGLIVFSVMIQKDCRKIAKDISKIQFSLTDLSQQVAIYKQFKQMERQDDFDIILNRLKEIKPEKVPIYIITKERRTKIVKPVTIIKPTERVVEKVLVPMTVYHKANSITLN